MSKRLLILFFLILVVILTAQEKEATPQIQFEATEFNFGEIDQHLKLPFEFSFQNRGQGILRIDNIQPTCGCTLLENPPSELAPGAKAAIKGTFNSGVYSGEVVRTIVVTSNDPISPKIELLIKCKVIEKVTLEPRTLTIPGVNEQKEKILKEVTLRHSQNAAFTIVSVLNKSEHLHLTYSTKTAPEHIVKVEIDPLKIPEAKNNGNIQIDDIKLQIQVEGEEALLEKILYVYLY